MSIHEISRVYGLHRDTVRKMLRFSVPPGYQRSKPPRKPKLGPFTGVIDAILQSDKDRPKKQRHTAKRIFERIRDEHDYPGGCTIVKGLALCLRRRVCHRFYQASRIDDYCFFNYFGLFHSMLFVEDFRYQLPSLPPLWMLAGFATARLRI